MRCRLLLLFPFLLLIALDAHSAVFTVGQPPCTHTTLTAALAAAEASPVPDVIRLRASGAYNNVGLLKLAADELTIAGGFASCTSATATATTVLRGSTGRSVIRQRGGHLILRDLYITGGSPSDGLGGGVHASGPFARLDLERVSINGNSAVNGGGLYIDGSVAATYASVSASTLRLENNSAKAGGGLYLRNAQMLANGLRIASNLAYRDGGGVLVDANASLFVQAGASGGSEISRNRADRDGGGAVVRSGAVLWLAHSAAKAKEMNIGSNTAGNRGGAVYIENTLPGLTSTLVTQGINLLGNRAALGAVFSAFASAPAGSASARVVVGINDGSWLDGHQECAEPASCDQLSGNRAAADDGSIGSGAIGHQLAVGNGVVNTTVGAATMRDNQGYDLFDMRSPVNGATDISTLHLRGSLLYQNSMLGPLVEAAGDNLLLLVSSTLANNRPDASILRPGKYLTLVDSIVFEPTQPVVGGFDQFSGSNVLVADASGLPMFDGLLVDDPRFVDPAIGDYHLSRESIAIDRSSGSDAVGLERDHRDRRVDLPDVPGPGKQDLGCYERQPSD